MELLLVRHALPQRVEGADGPADPALADLGVRQAEALAGGLAGEPLHAVYTSPLRRAVETAAPLAARTGLGPVVDEDLAEFDRDASEYIPIEELRAAGDPRWQAMVDGRYVGAEHLDPEAWRATVVAAVERIVEAHPGQVVAVVCHGGVVNAYLSWVLRTPDPMFFEPAYASISRVLAARSGQREVRSVNETAHVRGLLPGWGAKARP